MDRKTTCDPSNAPRCNLGRLRCIYDKWICQPYYHTNCDPNEKPSCPSNTKTVCIDKRWFCSFDKTQYTGSVINYAPQTTRYVNGNIVCQQYDNYQIPQIINLNNFSTIVINSSDPTFKNSEKSGFTYNGGYYTYDQSNYYSQYTWDAIENPSPVIGLDLYAQFYYPQTIDDTSHDDAVCDVILFIYDPSTYNPSDDSFEYIAYTTIFSDTWASYKSIIDNCNNIVNFGDFVPLKNNKWIRNPNIPLTNSMKVGFCFGFFSNENLSYLNEYTGEYDSYSLRQINNNTSTGMGGDCPTKNHLNFRIYNPFL